MLRCFSKNEWLTVPSTWWCCSAVFWLMSKLQPQVPQCWKMFGFYFVRYIHLSALLHTRTASCQTHFPMAAASPGRTMWLEKHDKRLQLFIHQIHEIPIQPIICRMDQLKPDSAHNPSNPKEPVPSPRCQTPQDILRYPVSVPAVLAAGGRQVGLILWLICRYRVYKRSAHTPVQYILKMKFQYCLSVKTA